MPGIKLFLLGPPGLESNGLPVKVETRKVMALLAYLAVMEASYRRDSLVNLLWPESDLTHGRGVLRRTLSALSSVLPENSLLTDRDTIGLNPKIDPWVDVVEFRHCLDRCRNHGHSRSEVCPACLPELTRAVEVYRDDFMNGFSLADSFNFDDWQFFQAETLHQEVGGALGKLAQCQVLQGEFTAAVACCRRRLALDPLNEAVHGDLMRLYTWTQQRGLAQRQFEECKQILQSQLGVEPQQATVDLAQAIKNGTLPPPPTDPAWQSTPSSDQLHEGGTERFPAHAGGQETGETTSAAQPGQAAGKRIVTILSIKLSLPSGSGDAEQRLEEKAHRSAELLEQVKPILAQYGGRIESHIGDSLLIVFGLTHTRENDPELTLRAAIDIQRQSRRSGLAIAAGVTSGEVIVQPGSIPQAGDQRLTGDAIDRAIFLAGQAQPAETCVIESTYQLTRDTFQFTPLAQKIQLDNELLVAYRLEGLLAQAHKTRGIQGLRSPMVGRDRELDELQKALEKVQSGAGQVVAVVGEVGLGKSRLVEELRQQAAGSGGRELHWLEGRCLELSKDVSYWPFIDLLKVDFGWQAQDYPRANRARIEDALGQLVSGGYLPVERSIEIAVVLSHLLATYAEKDGEDPLASRPPDEVRQRTFQALRDYLLALAHRQPLALVFEDLHWADSLSLDLIYFLMEPLPQAPILLIAVYRPEQEYRTYSLLAVAERKYRQSCTEIRLHELSQPESFQMIDALLGASNLMEPVKALIWERCQGNPFYTQEVIHSLIEAGMLYHEDDGWQVNAGLDASALPVSIQSVILSRLDHLEEDHRQVLLAAAVIGRVFPIKVLQQAVPAGIDLEKVLWKLESRALVYQERAIPEVEYSFCHALMQEVIYHNTLRHRRKILHQCIAEAVEKLYTERLDEHYEQLAYHYEKSGNIYQAMDYLYKAGEKSVRMYANEVAITHLTKGLELLRALPETQQRDRQELSFLIALGVPQVHTYGHADEQVLHTYSRARELCLQTGDKSHLFDVLLGLRRYTNTRGDLVEAKRLSQEMLELADNSAHPVQQARAHMMLAETLYFAGEFTAARNDIRQGVALCQDQDAETHIRLYGNDTRLGCEMFFPPTLWLLGYPDQAQVELRIEEQILAGLSHPFSRAMGLFWISKGYQLMERCHEVQSLAEELLPVAVEHDFALYHAWGLVQLGWALAAQGQFEQGINDLKEGISNLQQRSLIFTLPESLFQLGEILAKSGQMKSAQTAIEEGITISQQTGIHHWLAEIQRLKGEILLETGKEAEAEACLAQALATARQQQARAWELRAANSLARLWQAQDKSNEARALLFPIYSWFTEGLNTPDLLRARELLDQLPESIY